MTVRKVQWHVQYDCGHMRGRACSDLHWDAFSGFNAVGGCRRMLSVASEVYIQRFGKPCALSGLMSEAASSNCTGTERA